MNNMCEKTEKLRDYSDTETENKIMFSSAAATATYKNRLWHFIFLFPSDRINPMFYFEKSEFLSTKSSGVSCGHSPGLWG